MVAKADETIPVPALGQQIPLTDDQIKANWPNLPTAQEIYGKVPCGTYDSNVNGKQVSPTTGLPNENSPTELDIASTIVNCTSTEPNFYTGGLVTAPQIWEQYNSTLWIDVPLMYLQTTSDGSSAVHYSSSSTTWAIGAYEDPTNISGSNTLWGACSFGEFTATSFSSSGSGNYLGVCVVSVETNNFVHQMAMRLDPSGMSIENEIIVPSTGHDYQLPQQTYVPKALTNNLYNTYIRYYNNGTDWAYCWNWTIAFTFTQDSSTKILGGIQPTAVVESNDANYNPDFVSWSTQLGGNYVSGGVSYPLPAACYLFNSNWYPSARGQYEPETWAYLGGNCLGTWGGVGGGPPPNWGVNTMGETVSPITNQFTVGPGQTQQTNGLLLWNYKIW